MPLKPIYLRGLPSLPDELRDALADRRPSRAQIARARRVIAELRAIVRRARERHELATGHHVRAEPSPVK